MVGCLEFLSSKHLTCSEELMETICLVAFLALFSLGLSLDLKRDHHW